MPDKVKLEIRRPDRPLSEYDIVPGIYTIGSDDDCHIRLPGPSVDTRHAILTIKPDGAWLEDLDGEKGTFIDGSRIHGRVFVKPRQEIKIGPFALVIKGDSMEAPQPAAQPAPETHPPPPAPTPSAAPNPVLASQHGTSFIQAPAQTLSPVIERNRSIKQQIHKELVERLDIKRLASSHIKKEELRERAMDTIKAIVAEVSGRLPPGVDPNLLIKDICDEALGLGPLVELLDDPEVTEIMINGPNQVYVEKNGKLLASDKVFMDEASVMAVIERIVSPLGRRIDESQPYVDARLPDGSRVNAIIHPLSLVGPCLTIRKFSKTPFTERDMIRFGTMTQEIADFVNVCVKLRKNIIVSGGTGSGKTTLLNVFSDYLPSTDRIVTIEDAAELRLSQVHVIRLEARPPNIEGKGAITIRDLVRNALRMRPDRIVVGECRGGEALDMLQAMNTGHDGSLTTIHANSPRDVISRLETMVLMSGMDLPVRAIREQVSSAIDLIVHESRFSDGSRKITSVTEVVGQEGEQITMQEIFEFTQTGLDENGKVVGHFKPTGSVPTFIEEVAARGLTIDRAMFNPRGGGNKSWK